MPFKTPLNATMTEAQNKALSKVGSLQTYTSAPERLFPSLPEEQQISTFDFSLNMLNSVSGDNAGDGVINKFINKIFAVTGPDSIVLEEMIVNAIADSLEAKDIFLAPDGAPSQVSGTTSGTTGGTTITGQTGSTENTEDFRQFDVLEYKFFSRTEPSKTASAPTSGDSIVSYTYSSEITQESIIIEVFPSTNEFPPFTQTFALGFDAQATLDASDAAIEGLKMEAKNKGFVKNGITYPKEGASISNEGQNQNPSTNIVQYTYVSESQFGQPVIRVVPNSTNGNTNVDKLPSFTSDIFPDYNTTLDELKKEAKDFGFVANGIQYPKEGSPAGQEITSQKNGPIEYLYFLEDQSEFGFNYRIANTYGLRDFVRKYSSSSNSENALANLKVEAQSSGFYEGGVEYPSIDETMSIQAGGSAPNPTNTPAANVPQDIIITVKNNNSSILPDFDIVYPYEEGENLIVEDIIDDLQEEANEFGFYKDNVEYPKTSTDISSIEAPFGNLVGTVFDISGGTIPGAIIYIIGSEPKAQVLTDVDGKYAIKELPSDRYSISASTGSFFKPKEEFLFQVKGGINNELNFTLEDDKIPTITASTASTESTTTKPTTESGAVSGNTILPPRNITYSYDPKIENDKIIIRVSTFENRLTLLKDEFPIFNKEYPIANNDVPTLISDLKLQASNSGFLENGIQYPKTGVVVYRYDVIGEPIQYFFKETTGGTTNNVAANEADGSLTLNLEVSNNNPNLPTFDYLFTLNGDEGIDYLSDLDYLSRTFQDDIKQNGFEYNGINYPRSSEKIQFEISNNIELPSFTAETSSASDTLTEAYEQIQIRHQTDFVVDGKKYPKAGSPIIDKGLVDASGNTINSTLVGGIPIDEYTTVYDATDIPVGTLEMPEKITFTALTEDLRNSLASLVNVNFNPADIGLTNVQYLNKYLLPELIAGKRELVKQIMTMLFGPKELMSEDPEIQEKLLNSAACGESMFSTTNNPSQSDKELEYNKIRLKKQLQKGKVEIVVSCQKVEISLPDNFVEDFDLLPSEEVGIPEENRPNPAQSFSLLSNFIESEVQSQRNEEDAAQVKKSFFQILIDKIMQYIGVAFSVSPEIQSVFNIINAELAKTGQPNVSPSEIMSSPCEVTDACKSGNKEEFKKKSAFSESLINSLYSLVLSMLINKLLSVVKLKIKQLIQEKAKEKILKLRKKMLERFKFLDSVEGAASVAGKAAAYKSSFESSGIKDIMEFNKNKK